MKVVAIVGMPGSGKSEAAAFFKKKGFHVLRFGSVIDDEIKNAGLAWTPKNNLIFRKKVRKEGMDAVAKKMLPKIKHQLSSTDKLILDGLYSWEEYKLLIKKYPGLKLLCVYARPEIRYKRLSKRKNRQFNKAEAKNRDISEIEDINKGGPIAISDYLIKNEKSLSIFHKELQKYLQLL